MPLTSIDHLFGIHPVVCCPKPLLNSSICFESDAFCTDYVERDFSSFYNEEYDYEEYSGDEYDEDYSEAEDYYDSDYTLPDRNTVLTTNKSILSSSHLVVSTFV